MKSIVRALVAVILLLGMPPVFGLERPDWLVRVPRTSELDRAALIDDRYPLVQETLGSLWLEVTSADAKRLEAAGRLVTRIDADPWSHEYWSVGFRPDSDRWLVESLGKILWEEENWAILRVEGKLDAALLHEARVFLSPLRCRLSCMPATMSRCHCKRRNGSYPRFCPGRAAAVW